MNSAPVAWPRSLRTPPDDPDLLAGAAANPGGSLAVIDGDLVGGDPNGYVPVEAVHGCWIIGPDGQLTGEYAENPEHGTPTDDFARLTELDHFWTWLPEEPTVAFRTAIAELLTEQVPGAVLEWLKVTDEPKVVSAGRQIPGDDEKLVLVRTGVALPFGLSVRSPDGLRDILWGVFTWAASGLDDPGNRKDRVWFDLQTDIAVGGELLSQRVYEVEAG
ncbi:hypothetical protein GCM10009839_79440 [Catenulispora yoronensis]|uniref:Uncharacterized protein n=1 Tax=Catenulispora yoronensis TaxID=450799 RepID=A0ABN2VB49_9ACTN